MKIKQRKSKKAQKKKINELKEKERRKSNCVTGITGRKNNGTKLMFKRFKPIIQEKSPKWKTSVYTFKGPTRFLGK